MTSAPPIPDPVLVAFFGGATGVGFLVAALIFLRFFTRTRDKLFIGFAAGFGLMALNQAFAGLLGPRSEDQSLIYLLRLAAFVLIIVAVIGKNMKRPPC